MAREPSMYGWKIILLKFGILTVLVEPDWWLTYNAIYFNQNIQTTIG